MVQVGNVPEIKAVKKHLDELKKKRSCKRMGITLRKYINKTNGSNFLFNSNR